MISQFDVVVIGAGPGGYVAAIRAAQLGFKTACIDKRDTLGGTCLNVGCIPSKALLHSSELYAWLCKDSKEHGINCGQLNLDFCQMMQRKEEVVKTLVNGIPNLFKKHHISQILGTARLVDPHLIEIQTREGLQKIQAKTVILASGSEPIPLPFLPFDEKKVVSSTGALSFAQVPKRLAVIGGGVIGVELASVYNRLGSEVVVIEMLDRLCAGMDGAISKALQQSLKKQGMVFHLSTKVKAAEVQKDGVQLQLSGERETELKADAVLVAVGRKPYSDGLGLQEIGIQMQRGFVVVDGNFRTNISHIYAIGDLIEGPMLAHRASEEGVAVAEILAGMHSRINYMTIPNVIYTHPEVAALGLTEEEAKAAKNEIVVGTAFFRGNPRARCNGDSEGFVKVIGLGKEHHLIGMHIIGPLASELIHSGMVAMEQRCTLKDLAHAPFAHPTLSEAIKEACAAALGIAIHV